MSLCLIVLNYEQGGIYARVWEEFNKPRDLGDRGTCYGPFRE